MGYPIRSSSDRREAPFLPAGRRSFTGSGHGEAMVVQAENPVTILVVDAEEAMRKILREALVKEGYVVVEASSGADALAKFPGSRPAAVFIAAGLSGMDGSGVCRSLRRMPGGEHVPILLITECGEDERILRAFEEGVTDFISRPVDATLLGHRTRWLLRADRVARDLRQRLERSNRALRMAGMGWYEWHVSQNVWDFSEESRRIFGFEAPWLKSPDSLLPLVHPEDRERVEKTLDRALQGEREFTIEHRIVWPNGRIRRVRNQALFSRNRQGRPVRMTGTVRDVTDRLQAEDNLRENEARLNFLAYHDALTGLPNRLLFQDRLQHSIAKAHRFGRKIAVLFLDLDQFKRINDYFGHAIGDQLLQKVAKRIRCGAREEDTLARFGGDEFVLLLEDVAQVNSVGIVADKVLASLAQAFEVGGIQLYAAASIGISIYPDNGESAEELFRCADSAMYRAKELGRNSFQFYTPEVNSRAREALCLASGLRQALPKDELEIYYQPQYDLASGRVSGAEALLRWNHPERGLLPPPEFLPLAAETGLIFAISDWILQTVCRQNKAWQTGGLPPLVVAVNIPPRVFQQRELVRMVERALSRSGLEARYLELEITESMILDKGEAVTDTLLALNRLGVTLVINDFGSGYAPFSGLRKMPVTKLKLDRRFVQDLAGNVSDATLAASVIAMARSMNLGVSAAGVETEEQLSVLKARGCRQGQGALFGRPLAEGQFAGLLARHCPGYPCDPADGSLSDAP
ncbi:MAG TPA: EAL domain-containing protein [Geopsychrobacteraceae bacterium]